jgi:hypothetical protein
MARRRSGVLSVTLRTSRQTPGGYVRTSYTAAEVDAIAAYSPELHRGFLIPIEEASGRRSIQLRLDATKNNQAEEIKWARDYEFAPGVERLRSSAGRDVPSPGSYTSFPDPGAIAQLGERFHGMEEVVGSSPTSSM